MVAFLLCCSAQVAEFLRGFYGPAAAPLVLEHMHIYANFSRETGAAASNCGCDVLSDGCVTVPMAWASFARLDEAVQAERRPGRPNRTTVVATRLERLRLSPHYVLLQRWGEACAFAKQHRLAWPASLGGKVLGAAVRSWAAAVAELLGAHALATEQSWLASHRSSATVCSLP